MKDLRKRYMAASEEDKAVIAAIMGDVLDAVTHPDGGGILFLDKEGAGVMCVHVIGDPSLAPRMLAAAPMIYDNVFGMPDEATVQ